MRTHPQPHTLLAFLDGELNAAEESTLDRHVERCSECSAALSAMRGTSEIVSDAVQARDEREPAQWTGTQVRRLTIESRHAVLEQPRRAGWRPDLRWAAGITLVVGAAASAMVLAGPLVDEPVPAEAVVTPAAPAAEPEAAITVLARDGSLRVALRNAPAGSRVFVTTETRATASVLVRGVPAPYFTAEDGRVDIDVRGAVVRLHVVVPDTLRSAIVAADGVTLATVRGAVMTPTHAAREGVSVDAVTSRME